MPLKVLFVYSMLSSLCDLCFISFPHFSFLAFALSFRVSMKEQILEQTYILFFFFMKESKYGFHHTLNKWK